MERVIRPYWPVFVLPTLLACVIGFVIPFAMGVYLSFCSFTTLSDAVFTGFDNYVRAFSDGSGAFWHALWYTGLFALLSTALINALALLAALALVRGFRGTNGFRTVFFMPNLIGGIVLGWLWQVILNGFLSRRGLTLTTSEWYGFWGLMIVVTWQQMGYMMIIYIAGLHSIPPGGAGGRRHRRRVPSADLPACEAADAFAQRDRLHLSDAGQWAEAL